MWGSPRQTRPRGPEGFRNRVGAFNGPARDFLSPGPGSGLPTSGLRDGSLRVERSVRLRGGRKDSKGLRCLEDCRREKGSLKEGVREGKELDEV